MANFLVDVAQIVVEARAAVQNEDGPEAADQAWAEGEQLDDAALTELLGAADDSSESKNVESSSG